MGAGHCQWVGLTNRNICMSVGPTAAAGEAVADAKTEGQKVRKYIMINLSSQAHRMNLIPKYFVKMLNVLFRSAAVWLVGSFLW